MDGPTPENDQRCLVAKQDSGTKQKRVYFRQPAQYGRVPVSVVTRVTAHGPNSEKLS